MSINEMESKARELRELQALIDEATATLRDIFFGSGSSAKVTAGTPEHGAWLAAVNRSRSQR